MNKCLMYPICSFISRFLITCLVDRIPVPTGQGILCGRAGLLIICGITVLTSGYVSICTLVSTTLGITYYLYFDPALIMGGDYVSLCVSLNEN